MQQNPQKNRKPILAILVLLILTIIKINSTDTSVSATKTLENPTRTTFNFDLPELTTVSLGGTMLHKEPTDSTPRPTASTAKMILALMVREQKPFPENEPGEYLQITSTDMQFHEYCITNGGSCSFVEEGQWISVYDALTTILLISSNNLSDTIATWAFGSIETYTEYANHRLKEWGINHTHVADTSGFNPETTSTSEDLLKIGEKVLQDPVLNQIVHTVETQVAMVLSIANSNHLLLDNGAISIKTGWIGELSNHNLVAATKHLDEWIVVSLMNRPTRAAAAVEALTAIAQVKEQVITKEIIAQNQIVGQIETWWSEPVPILADQPLSIPDKGQTWQTRLELEDSTKGFPSGQIGNLILESNQDQNTQPLSIPVKIETEVKHPNSWQKLWHF